MKVTIIGGPLHGQSVEIANALDEFVHEVQDGSQIRYIKRLWSKAINEQTREVGQSAYFVAASLADQEASALIIKHIKEHGAQ